MFLIVLLAAIVIAVVLKSDGVQRAPDGECEFAGVCAGLAYRYELNITAVRILWVIGTLCVGGGLLLYIILWAILPQRNHA